MKKKILYIILFLIIILLLFIIYSSKEKKKQEEITSKLFKVTLKTTNEVDPEIYYEFDDRYIYIHKIKKVKFTYDTETKELKKWLKNDPDFLEKMINELNKITTTDDKTKLIYYDGGTTEYRDGDINIIVCNTLDGNKNIHIGKNLTDKNMVCLINKKQVVTKKAKNDKIINIIDKATYIDNFVCSPAPDYFYEDKYYRYSWGCLKGMLVIVQYESGYEETVKEALESNSITITDLDKYNINYYKDEK